MSWPSFGFTPTACWLIAFAAVAGSLFGYDTGVVSGSILMLSDEIPLSTAEKEFVVSSTTLFAAFGALLCVPLNSFFGRKPVLASSGLQFVVGAIIVSTASSFGGLVVGRMLLGLAIGFSSATVPMFAAELAPRSARGVIVVLNDLSIVLGQLAAGFINGAVLSVNWIGRWRLSLGLACVPAVVQLLLLIPLPESPRWMVRKRRVAEAETALLAMDTDPERVAADLKEIGREIELEKETLSKAAALLSEEENASQAPSNECISSILVLWSTPALLHASLLGMLIMALNQLSGINTVMYYSATILQEAGFASDKSVWLSACCDAAQLLGVIISISSVDTFGRRPTMLRSCAGVFFFLILLAVIFSLSFDGQKPLLVVALMGYLISFGAGLSGVPWVLVSEIFPSRARAMGVGMCVFVNWLMNFAVSESFLSLSDAITVGGTFGIYAIFAGVGCVLCYLYVPETKGMRLEEIEALFREAYPSVNEASSLIAKEDRPQSRCSRLFSC
ncbi:hypothetical protein AB1Y20_019942 [Prymnesium parvum]|uniref:Major facilitator superfamily (MFS) profile domain-containing protein n=1 Tax=Prymnesium parvum TaxID=97485 RepID=A0AB34JXC0_PRYPA